MNFGDETTAIILNTKGTKGDVSDDLKDFLKSVNGEYTNSDFSVKIKGEVDKVKRSEEWRREYMTLYLHEQEIKAKARKEGKLETLVSLVKNNLLSTTDAAQTAELPEEEFLKLMDKY